MFVNYVLTTPLSADDAAAAMAQLQSNEKLDVHIVPAVAGSIVRIRVRLRRVWLGILALLAVLWTISAAWSYALRKPLAPELFEFRASWLYEWHAILPRVFACGFVMMLIVIALHLFSVRQRAIKALRNPQQQS
jgi:hypothetical protein